ncbi:hypothetical protein N7517_003897 [Penicillium concentricum]|uniref:Uncharacterized protein n=1 Tax=Penicillium concentricum TaxID=293559 RepID=A0A9W9VA58_9EURO|nr:uncharacterized protein N7517_003897 [Penicillium concentricum]KAJ5371891.1 hypothetical protein N7517_003897 [Penicillium concentricum]
MEAAGLGLAVFGACDTWLKYGAVIIQKYKGFKEAENEIKERVVSIEATWRKISQQLGLLKRIWDTQDEDLRDLQERILRILQTKLDIAVLHISKLEKRGSGNGRGQEKRKAARYALDIEKSLDRAILDLQLWERKFDPSWFLILPARHIRDALKNEPQRRAAIFRPEDKLTLPSGPESHYQLSKFVTSQTRRPSSWIRWSVTQEQMHLHSPKTFEPSRKSFKILIHSNSTSLVVWVLFASKIQ